MDWKTQDFTRSVSAAISYIKRCLKSGVTAYKAAPDRTLIVAYEELVSDPERERRAFHPLVMKSLDREKSLKQVGNSEPAG